MEQITRQHPQYDAVTDILRRYPELHVPAQPNMLRVPDEQVWRDGRDCGALCGMTILDLQPPLILDLLWDAAQATMDLLMDWMGLDRVTLDRS